MDPYSAHQGVEDDDMNVMCLGGLVTGSALAWDLVQSFLSARFKGAERFKRRLAKISDLEGLTMNEQELINTARALTDEGKGLLAMDESTKTCNKRFARWEFLKRKKHAALIGN